MLTLIEGSIYASRDSLLIERINETLKEGTRSFLIVPEQETLTRESLMSSILPSNAPLTFEVTNFTRFINTAFRTLGGLSGEYCDSSLKSLIMWRTLTELSPMLNMTRGKNDITPGAVSRALSAVGEMQSLAIIPEDLIKAEKSGFLKDSRLSSKLSDLYLIYSLYKKLLTEKYGDVSDDTLSLAEMLAKNGDYLKNTRIFIDGFTSFTEPQYRLIKELIRSSDVTVTIALPRGSGKMFEYSELENTHTRLIRTADLIPAKKAIIHTDTSSSKRTDPSRLAELLFRTNDGSSEQKYEFDGVRIFSAPTPFDECAFISADIKVRVMNGARYTDFAIIARSCESYSGILDRALDAADIPYFFSRTKDISSFEAIKLIHTAYAIIKRGFAREDVITYLKCTLSGISKDEADIFELFVEKWNIDGSAFTSEDPWCMNPRGYEVLREDDLEHLQAVNSVKERLTAPLISFRDDVRSAKTVREHAEALFGFLSSIGLEASLYERSELLIRLNEKRRAEENSRLFKIICDALDRLVDVMGDMPADSEGFINQFTVLLSANAMGSIPSHVDEVTVGSADMIRLRSKKHVYLLGVNEGKFPALAPDRSYFSDRDKSELRSAGLAIEPDMLIRSARELYSFARAMSFADETVTLTWCERSAALEPLSPSEVIERISDITGKNIKSISIASLPLSERIFSPEDAYSLAKDANEEEKKEIEKALRKAGEREILEKTACDVSNDNLSLGSEAIGIIYKGDLYLSQSKIESYLSCPFSYFLKYNLRLTEADRAELSPLVIGNFLHSVLEDFFSEIRRSGRRVNDLSEKEKAELTERAASRYVKEALGDGYGKERTRVAIKRLCRAASPVVDGICDEFSACKFEPTLFELSTYGKNPGDAKPIVYECDGGKKIIIRGKVDRVDTYKDGEKVYVRVVDYKSSSKDFSPKDLDKGMNMQMFLYLKSIVDTKSPFFLDRIGAKEGDEIIPAGVIYTKASVKDVSVKHSSDEEATEKAKEQSTREGMVLDDTVSLEAMNPYFTPLEYPETDKNASKNSEKKYTLEGWEKISLGMESTIRNISGRMCSGDIPADPTPLGKYDPCDFCSYRAVCRKR